MKLRNRPAKRMHDNEKKRQIVKRCGRIKNKTLNLRTDLKSNFKIVHLAGILLMARAMRTPHDEHEAEIETQLIELCIREARKTQSLTQKELG